MATIERLPEQSQYPFTVDRFRHWLVAFAVCNFNVDLGPEMELVYPETPFSTSNLSAICFNCFPERQETEPTEDISFHFKIRNDSPAVPLRSPCEPYGSPDSFYGYCRFHQEADALSKRKYEQKTLVLVSNHCFPTFFLELLRVLMPSYLIDSIPALEAACVQISSWASPSIGDHQLPFLGSLVNLNIAAHPAFPLQGISTSVTRKESPGSSPTLYAYAPEASYAKLTPYLSSLSELYAVFESLLICEPVIVLSNSPQICSEFVSAAVDLVRPVPYSGDCRPYLTMQSAFSSTAVDGGLPRSFLVGITNPFLVSRILSIAATSQRRTPYVVQLKASSSAVPLRPEKHHRHPVVSELPSAQPLPDRAKTNIAKDKDFLKAMSALLGNTPPPADALASSIRRHFATLAANFLAPFSRYFATLVSAAAVSPSGNLQYANFNEADFLRSLAKYGSAVPFKGRTPLQRLRAQEAFYKRFCASPNFFSWLEMKMSLDRAASAGVPGLWTENAGGKA